MLQERIIAIPRNTIKTIVFLLFLHDFRVPGLILMRLGGLLGRLGGLLGHLGGLLGAMLGQVEPVWRPCGKMVSHLSLLGPSWRNSGRL